MAKKIPERQDSRESLLLVDKKVQKKVDTDSVRLPRVKRIADALAGTNAESGNSSGWPSKKWMQVRRAALNIANNIPKLKPSDDEVVIEYADENYAYNVGYDKTDSVRPTAAWCKSRPWSQRCFR